MSGQGIGSAAGTKAKTSGQLFKPMALWNILAQNIEHPPPLERL